MGKDCCKNNNGKKTGKGFFSGILYGILPHTFCILFIIFTVLGTTAFSVVLRPLMLKSYFFYVLISLSFVLAAVSAVIYLKKIGELSFAGIKRKWKYLSVLFGTMIAVNLVLFLVIFPALANIDTGKNYQNSAKGNYGTEVNGKTAILKVEIPCSGHATLISDELKKIDGVESVKFRLPNFFDVTFDPAKTDIARIAGIDIFKEYKATVINE
jgi:copper chaperone CopZ